LKADDVRRIVEWLKCQGHKRLLVRHNFSGDGLATEYPNAATPVAVAEPAPAPDPALGVLVPVDVVDALGVVRMTPVREDEVHLAPQNRGNLVLVIQEILPVVSPEVGVHLAGSLNHGVADYRRLLFPKETEDVVSAAADSHLGRDGVFFEELVTELLKLVHVSRVDQSLKPLIAELFREIGNFT